MTPTMPEVGVAAGLLAGVLVVLAAVVARRRAARSRRVLEERLEQSQREVAELARAVAGLSRAESADLTQLMREVADRGVTVLLVEHDVAAVMEVSDRVAVLNLGTLLADGTAAQVRNDVHVRAAYLGEEDT